MAHSRSVFSTVLSTPPIADRSSSITFAPLCNNYRNSRAISKIDKEVGEFIQSTLESVDQIPVYVRDNLGEQPDADVRDEIHQTLTWLTKYGLLHKPIRQPQTEDTRYTSINLGTAFVEYEHSNRFDNRVESVLELTEWLYKQGQDCTPESLVQRLAADSIRVRADERPYHT